MQLYSSPTSPFARKVRVVIAENAIGAHIEEIFINPLDDHDANPNPLGKIPALKLSCGTVLFDSPLLCAYLLDRLTKQNGEINWHARQNEALADGVMDAAVRMVMECRRPDTQHSAFWLARWQTAIEKGLDMMAGAVTRLPRAKAPMDVGQIAIGCALGYLDFRFTDFRWRAAYPALEDWWAECLARESFAQTQPDR